MKKTRHFIKRKILKTRRVLLRARTERPALFTALVILFFSFGGLLVWGGATITTTLFSNNLTQGLVAHYAFDGGDLSGPNPNILFVVGANPLNAADQYLHDIMTLDMGSSVTVLLASANAPTYFTPYDVVVISESSLSVDVASKYNNAGIGVVNMENASWAAHDLVGGDTTVTATTSVNVVGGDHPVAAGYSGTTTLFTSAAQMRRNSVALPAEAVSIMQETGDSSRHIAFAYEKGATMLNAHTAEARRVALGFHSDTYSVFGQPAKDIFMAAVRWAANTTLEESITIRETGEFMGSTTLAAPVGEGNSNHGPYVAHGKQWIFFSNGAGGFVYKTKDLQGGTWSAPSSSYSSYIGQGRYFNFTFDGTHFHLLYRISGNAVYRRFTPNPDGTVTAGSAITFYDDVTWSVDYSDFYITTDYQGRPWVQFQVTDGTNFKPVVSASTATDGTWTTRAGFPYDLHTSSIDGNHAADPGIVELGNDKMIFTWRDTINSRMSARVWDNGTWNSVENTGLAEGTYARTSTISPAPGEVLVNSFTNVAHRATNGAWSSRSPGGMNTSSDNSFSRAGNTVRLWDISGNDIRYKETSDAGLTWGPITTFVTAASAPQFTSTSEIDDYHTVVWATGVNPYVRFAGIDGEIVTGDALGRVTDRSGNDNHGTVSGGVVTSSGRIGQAAEFNGSNGYVSAGNIGTNIRSISFWMKPENAEAPIVRLSDSASIDIEGEPQPSTITYIGQATGTTSATLPTHQAGDLILAWAYRDGSETSAPQTPYGWGTVAEAVGNSQSAVIGWKIAESSGTSSDTWTAASNVVFQVYRGVDQNRPVGAFNFETGVSTTVSYPDLAMRQTDGTSWVAGFSGHREVNTSLETPPTGMTDRANVVNSTISEASGHDTNGPVSSWGNQNVSVGGTSSGWLGATVEILSEFTSGPAEGDISYISGASGVNSLTMPSHQAGDLLVMWAYRDGSTTPPTVPAGWTTPSRRGVTGTNSGVVAYKIAASGSETSGTWTNATSTIVGVYRNVDQYTPIGGERYSAGAAGSVTYSAVGLMAGVSGRSWLVGLAGHRSTDTTLETPPTGMVNRVNVVDATDEASLHDTNGERTSNWPNSTVFTGGTTSYYHSSVIEIMGAAPKISLPPAESGNVATTGITSPTVYVNGVPGGDVVLNEWQHVVITTTSDISASDLMIGRNGDSYFSGQIDDVRIYDTTLSSSDIDRIYHLGATTTINTSLNPPELQVGLVGYWPFDQKNVTITNTNNAYTSTAQSLGAILVANQSRDASFWYDESGNSFNGTLVNAPTWNASGGPGEGVPGFFTFNGTNQLSNHGNNAAFEFTQAHTLVWWERTSTVQATDYATLLSKGDRSYHVRAGLASTGSNERRHNVRNDALSYDQSVITTLTDPSNWNMYVARHSGTRISIYRVTSAGATELVGANASTDLGHTASAFSIGAQDNSGTIRRWWKGDIAGVLAFDKSISTAEMELLYEKSAAPPEMSVSNITDISSSGNNGTVDGRVLPAVGRAGQGLQFSGTAGSIATIPDHDSLDIGSGSFTYGAWIKPDAFVGAYDMPISKGGASAGDTGWDMELGTDGWGAGISDGTIVRIVFFNDNGFSPPYLPAGQWYHLMAVVDRSSNEFRAYRDGVLINTTSITGFGTSNSTKDLTLGGRPGGTPELFNGVIDDLRVYNRALSSAEIDRLYRLGATTKVNTTLPAESSAGGPIAHWTFDGPTISGSTVQDVAGTSNGTLFGASATPGRVGQALSLDGVDDYVNMGNPAALVFGTGDFSYCYWLKTRATSGQPVGKGVWNFRAWGTYITDGRVRFEVKVEDPPGTSFTADTAVINDGVWYHLCGTHDRDGLLSVYTNGNLSNTTNMSAGASYGMLTSNDFLIGDGFPGHFEGAIDDVRVYDRVLSEEEVQRLASLAPSSGGSIAVNAAPPAATGFITVERWDNVSGGLVSDIPVGTTPDYTGTLSTMESPFTGDLYGVRIRGYIYPETTGNYTFWLASDDGGALNLSTDDTEGNKVTIASHSSWTGSREWNKFTSQQSAPIALVAGQRYYIEALQKENAGGDNLAVAWKLNDTTDPVNGSADNIIPGSVLSEWE